MKTRLPIRSRLTLTLLLSSVLLAVTHSAISASLTLPNKPLSSATGVDVKPNIMFILDDSLSMELDYLPDWAGGATNSNPLITFPVQAWHTRNSRFNGLAYNPGIRYQPPTYYTSSGTLDTTTYPSQTAAVTSNWTQVKSNPYAGNTTVSLIGNAPCILKVVQAHQKTAGSSFRARLAVPLTVHRSHPSA